MIGHIQGVLTSKQPPEVVLDVQGIGYEIQLPMTCFYQLPPIGETIKLITHFVVREDAQLLYGFISASERSLFRLLLKTQGVGPKLALAILSGMSADEFVMAVNQNDVTRLVKLPGVGKKTAERLVIEMRDRLKDWQPSTPFTDRAPLDSQGMDAGEHPADARTDAISALQSLGYKENQAEKALQKVYSAEHNSETLIRLALKQLS
ncbi:MAG: Holliday junction branch migration protein RuvA [Idiomarinaceae bacterium]|uniref:Holliday junction branch migration protein RuvA n=1 Tax=Idiomarina sp. 28-8 TaxID=1260624 RepID=UPI0002DB8A07|nr:Holliday junction branch migration protein RuvA [Idiomarina sp. 28-8]NWO02338.1 Holliday junction branch migration protein RuvA [Idiomarinaceae bacterium]